MLRIRGVTRYDSGGAHIKSLLKKWWGTMLSNHQKVVGHVPPGPTYGDTPEPYMYILNSDNLLSTVPPSEVVLYSVLKYT